MVNRNEDSSHTPRLPADDDTEPTLLAPSKPAVPAAPARRVSTFDPEPIEVEDADSDIIAVVTPPPPEEVMPTDGRAAWESVPMFTSPTGAPTGSSRDPFRSLGDAAVARASLSASGAPTPLGGVGPSSASAATGPIPTGSVTKAAPANPVAPAPAQPSAPARSAAPPAPASAVPAGTTAPGFMAAEPPKSAGSPPRSSTPELEDEAPPFTPIFGTPMAAATAPDATGGDASNGDKPPAKEPRTPWWRSWPVLVLLGLLVMGAIAWAIIEAQPEEEPVELTPEVVVGELDEPTHDPVSIDDPTQFQAALPQMVGLFALTGYETPDVDNLDLTGRVAEATLLTYEYQDTMLAARAVQHFDVETAIAQFEEAAEEGTDRAPVLAGEEEVGERVTVSAEDSTTLVWRNGTALISVTGPADAVEEFFDHFTL